MGHVKAVKDVCFSNDGRRFLSCGYDRQMKLWDTETGQCIKRFSNGKIPYVIKFHPDEDKQNIFLAGMSDKKIIQVSRSLVTSFTNNHEPALFLVRYQFGGDCTRIRPASRTCQYDYIRRRKPEICNYLG